MQYDSEVKNELKKMDIDLHDYYFSRRRKRNNEKQALRKNLDCIYK